MRETDLALGNECRWRSSSTSSRYEYAIDLLWYVSNESQCCRERDPLPCLYDRSLWDAGMFDGKKNSWYGLSTKWHQSTLCIFLCLSKSLPLVFSLALPVWPFLSICFSREITNENRHSSRLSGSNKKKPEEKEEGEERKIGVHRSNDADERTVFPVDAKINRQDWREIGGKNR